MEIEQIETGETITLKVSGKLTAGTAEDFGVTVTDALTKTAYLVLDFQGVTYVASAGLRVLVLTQKKLAAAGGTLILRNLKSGILEIFQITGLDSIFTIE
ncbi:MAG: STAS domain-containing protein [Treponema sp.]|jgi:anti-sigma B factor antagonist|nr:STAS domain-containing protein [Treponema sp.]